VECICDVFQLLAPKSAGYAEKHELELSVVRRGDGVCWGVLVRAWEEGVYRSDRRGTW
jgi:hypothetical protein